MLVMVFLIKKRLAKQHFNSDLLFLVVFITIKILLSFHMKTRTELLMFFILSYVFMFVMARADKATALAQNKQKYINSK